MKPRPELLKAYRQTSYEVEAPGGPLSIRIGEAPPPELVELLVEHEVGSWAYVTACNPRSERLSAAANRKRLEALQQRIEALGFASYAGAGVGDGGAWPAEPSLLILGINLEDARALAVEFDQLAIVFGRFNKPAQLVWCDE